MFRDVSCGFYLPDGWEKIVWDLCEKIAPLVEGTEFKVEQVKEKFGGLRFYVSESTDDVSTLIGEAEAASVYTCQRCGAPGERGGTGWRMTVLPGVNTSAIRGPEAHFAPLYFTIIIFLTWIKSPA